MSAANEDIKSVAKSALNGKKTIIDADRGERKLASVVKSYKRKKSSARPAAKNSKSASAVSLAASLKRIFEGAGFKHIKADDIHFTVDGRTGELDHIFVWENVVLLCEETSEASATKHCTNKIVFHQKIAADYERFKEIYWPMNPALDEALGKYLLGDIEFRHVYFSAESDVDLSIGSSEPLKILTRSQATYFADLVSTIKKSAKYELLKFVGVALHQVGEARISGAGISSNSFKAFVLPGNHTSYPEGFAVVSFYADPMSLIKRAYVLRRDGWEDPDLSYQRFVRSEKLDAMRSYLANNGKVFINNLVVTLPSDAILMGQDNVPVKVKSLKEKTLVDLKLPLELGTIGIVDGQHRILSYYEGDGEIEKSIARVRTRQNLLVTGIIFPSSYTKEMRVKFEAEIFLAINNNQTPVETSLRQDLETIIEPEKELAIARSIVTRLANEGPLAGLLQMSQFDPSDKIATGSIGPYVLVNMVKRNGALYKSWDGVGKRDLKDPASRKEFIDFCTANLLLLLRASARHLKSKFKSVPNGGVLSTTVVGGLILLFDRFVKDGQDLSKIDFDKSLKKIDEFDFSSYTSSAWGKLASNLYEFLKN